MLPNAARGAPARARANVADPPNSSPASPLPLRTEPIVMLPATTERRAPLSWHKPPARDCVRLARWNSSGLITTAGAHLTECGLKRSVDSIDSSSPMTNPLYIPPALPVDRPGPSQSFKPSHAPADPALLALLLGYWLAADALATRLIASRCWCSPSRVEVRTGHRDRPCSSSVACAPVGPIIGRHGYRHHAPPIPVPAGCGPGRWPCPGGGSDLDSGVFDEGHRRLSHSCASA